MGKLSTITAKFERTAGLKLHPNFKKCSTTKAVLKKVPDGKLFVYQVPGSAGEKNDAYAIVKGKRFISPDLNPSMAKKGRACESWELGTVKSTSGGEVKGPITGDMVDLKTAIKWLKGK